jgi:hypothetical protein
VSGSSKPKSKGHADFKKVIVALFVAMKTLKQPQRDIVFSPMALKLL